MTRAAKSKLLKYYGFEILLVFILFFKFYLCMHLQKKKKTLSFQNCTEVSRRGMTDTCVCVLSSIYTNGKVYTVRC